MEEGERSQPRPAAKTQLTFRMALLALSLIGVLAVGATIEIVNVGNRSAVYQDELERSIEQRSQIRRISTLLHEAEATQRGYLLTDSPAFRDMFGLVQRESLMRLEQLPDSFGESGEQRSRAARLGDLIRQRLARLSSNLEAYGRDPPSARELVASQANISIHTMVEIRELVDRMISFEEEQIRSASRLVDEQLSWSRTVVIVLLAAIVVLVAGILGVGVIHLSRRGRIELQLDEARQLAESASRAKSEFLASMSHEIRTPLTSILGYTELLLGERLTRQQRVFVERLQTSSAGLLALVNDILDFSKIEAREVTLEQEPVSLRALVADVMSIVSTDANKKGIRLLHEIDPALPERVLGDALRIRQILLNLLSNAVKFTEKGSVTLRISRADNSPDRELIRIEVQDTGIGIPREQRQRLFRRFSQVDASIQRRYGGSGLGLAISRRLVELMGGEIGVESEEGLGSTFWVVAPLPQTEINGIEQPGGEVTAEAAPRARILLAEDSPQNQDLASTVLSRAGHHVDIARDGEEALAALEAGSYDLVLMDMQMPRMDGLTATRRIRESSGPAKNVPIIAMTANVLPEHLQQFKEAGANDHISKPFRLTLLVEVVNRWLASNRKGEDSGAHATADLTMHDRATLNEARALLGDEWIRDSLSRLKARIHALPAAHAGEPPDVDDLKRQAHQLVADAGQLGFTELSLRCSELEQACAQGQNIPRTLGEVRQAGRLAVVEIDRLLDDAGDS